MSKSLPNRSPACSRRHACAIRGMLPDRGHVGGAERAALDVADDQHAVLGAVLDDRRARPGRGRGHRFRYSQSRSIASSSVPPEEIRATKAPSGVVTL